MGTCARCRPSRRHRLASMTGWPPPQPPQRLYQDTERDLATPVVIADHIIVCIVDCSMQSRSYCEDSMNVLTIDCNGSGA